MALTNTLTKKPIKYEYQLFGPSLLTGPRNN